MPEVTCPACHTRQGVDPEAAGYTCVSCGADWDFVACASCGNRFHAAPDAPGWRCPTCGHENTRPHARIDLTAELPIGPNRMLVIGLIGIVLIALATWALTRDGDDGAAVSPTASASASGLSPATEEMCAHLVDIQTLRFDALGDVASTLRDDAAAIEAEGDSELAASVEGLARDVTTLQEALNDPAVDDGPATDAVIDTLDQLPC